MRSILVDTSQTISHPCPLIENLLQENWKILLKKNRVATLGKATISHNLKKKKREINKNVKDQVCIYRMLHLCLKSSASQQSALYSVVISHSQPPVCREDSSFLTPGPVSLCTGLTVSHSSLPHSQWSSTLQRQK